MRNQWWTFALPVMMACSSSSATSPHPTDAQFSIRFVLENPAALSVSDPLPCPGDWSTCPRDSQPQGATSIETVRTRDYTLPPGTYRLTGVLQPSASSASVVIQIGRGARDRIGGGVVREGPVLGFVRFTGESTPPLSSVVSRVCGATFSTSSGALEWSVTFRVVAPPQSPDEVCW